MHVAPTIFAQLFNFLYFANFLRDHCDVAFNRYKILSLSLCDEEQFGVLKHAVYLLARTEELRRKNPNSPHIEVMLQYLNKHPSHSKFKYDQTDSKWINVDCIIFTITMSYNSTNEVYTLDRNDLKQLFKFVTKQII